MDKSFIGADAVHQDGMASNVNIEEVSIKQAMIKTADKVILLTDSSKFQITAFEKVVESSELDYVITSQNIPKNFFEYYDKHNVQLIVT